MATFVIGGIWHGAGWTFVFWGFLHGVALVIQRIWSELGFRLNKFVAWFITFNFVNIAWVFFRAKEWDDALKVLKGMFFGDFNFTINFLEVLIIIAGLAIVIFFKASVEVLNCKFRFTIAQVATMTFFLFISFLAIRLGKANEFLYFNF